MINARSETASAKPTFRKALRERRCLIPTTGFYEWRTEGDRKQPFWIMQEQAIDPQRFVMLVAGQIAAGRNLRQESERGSQLRVDGVPDLPDMGRA